METADVIASPKVKALLVTARNDSLKLEMNLPHLKPMP